MRPRPPAAIFEPVPTFVPAPELDEWARQQFINEISPLHNPDHLPLSMADIGFVWTNVENVKKGRRILGTCQMVTSSGDKWTQGRSLHQLEQWFGDLPDFLITLDGMAAADMDDASFMALVEHELYHATQATDEFGAPKFQERTGLPMWGMRPHDVEQFIGVVKRYGADASMVRELVTAANKGPEIAQAKISAACGSCLRLVKG
jgi:hypothetical protein